MAGHSHDNIDWDTRIRELRDADEFTAPETQRLVRELLAPQDRRVVEIGAGAGGTAAAFASALDQRSDGGSVVIVDTAPQLLTEASRNARDAVSGPVEVTSVQADAAEDELVKAVGEPADLVFAGFAVHHLPDQLAGLRRLSRLARPGGRVALVETGLSPRVLPWDVGVGEPGLEERLAAANYEWFRQMRTGMDGSVRLPYGWPRAMTEAGMADVRNWTYLIDRPAPLDEHSHAAVMRRLEILHDHASDQVSAADRGTLDQLLDPAGAHYVGNRDDLYYLAASTVTVATVPASA